MTPVESATVMLWRGSFEAVVTTYFQVTAPSTGMRGPGGLLASSPFVVLMIDIPELSAMETANASDQSDEPPFLSKAIAFIL